MRRKTNRHLLFKLYPLGILLILVAAVGLACSLPSRSQPEAGDQTPESSDLEEPPPSPTLPPPPTPTPQPLPPTLVEVDPVPGTDIALQGELK